MQWSEIQFLDIVTLKCLFFELFDYGFQVDN